MALVYDFIYFLFCLVYLPYLFIKGKWHGQFKMRFGCFPRDIADSLQKKSNIWIHAVSVGEVLASSRLVTQIKEQFPSYRIVISTVTTTGYAVAKSTFTNREIIIYAPCDFSWVIRKFIKVIQPKVYIMTETEIWPNIITALHLFKTRILLVNGRISKQSFKGYKAVWFLTQRVLERIDSFCMQTHDDADRIVFLGASRDKVRVVGNVKFDASFDEASFSLGKLGIRQDDIVWLAGSTHPGEEEIVTEVYKELREEFEKLRLIIAPRHPERTPGILKMIKNNGFQTVRFSTLDGTEIPEGSVVVIDVMGYLKHLYSIAHFVFMGKSLVGHGGQNMIEPGFFAKAVLVGPYTDNFKDVVEVFAKRQAILQVKDKEDLLVNLRLLLRHPEKRQRLGQAAKEVVLENRGATARTVEILEQWLRSNP